MGIVFWLVMAAIVIAALARTRPSLPMATVAGTGILVIAWAQGALGGVFGGIVVLLFMAVAALFNIRALRLRFVSAPLLDYVRKVLPPMSDTERAAIEAGTVWWEAELFRGKPEWDRLLEYPEARLSEREQAFVDGPAEALCAMMDDWQITYELNDLPEDVWQFIKENRFLGMVIPEEYGGLGFSPLAHSEVVMKLAARSVSGGVSVMVPNSLGPAELLLHYGTDEQKNHYLPRLARGDDIPCFALTGPEAGSDAGAMTDFGIVCRGMHEGREVLGLRVTWEKRYITLGPIATVLGLAFKAYDPDGLLGDVEDIGITCALIPTSHEGVNIGRRHFPLNSAFMNGPNSGKDVFIPMDWIIGGQEMIGQGWRMLMESLSVGRGISLPANGVASGKSAARFVGAYARVRHQFGLPIGKFEGIQEVLGRVAALTYTMDAGRRLTAAALAEGEKPSVVSAILKYYNTEAMRTVINDGMDVIGGKGICMGPSNFLGRAYQAVPVGITVEGANILTRSLIVFGQGALRCHPWLLEEMRASALPGHQEALEAFDEALRGHMGYAIGNGARSFMFGITKAFFASSPVDDETGKYYRRLARMSAAYAFLADFAMLFLGGGLKRKEMLSGRFADGMMHMYMASAVLKRFEDTGRPAADRPLVEWSVRHALWQTQIALDQILRNFPSTTVGLLLRGIIFPLGRRYRTPNDEMTQACAELLLAPSPARDRLTAGVYLNNDRHDVTGSIEHAFNAVIRADEAHRKLRATRREQPYGVDYGTWVQQLVAEDVLERDEAELLREAADATARVIAVDDFPNDVRQGGSVDDSQTPRAKKRRHPDSGR
ncbi:MAG: acyl-CoA dehydrogenase [Gammaproteobacteria bacterium]|nr:MAG: acyl-CoA dehydrogenase [Gammaproteobacteria bacterium]